MNFNNGMQRLAIFAGMLGAIAGGVQAYKILRKVPSERYQHRVYEELSASKIVKNARTRLLNPDYAAGARKYGGSTDPSGNEVISANWGSEPAPNPNTKIDYAAGARNYGGSNATGGREVINARGGTNKVLGVPPGLTAEPIPETGNIRGLPDGATVQPLPRTAPPAVLHPIFQGGIPPHRPIRPLPR